MATDFCPSAATRSTSLYTSQAPSSREYSVCRCRWVNSDMASLILVGGQLERAPGRKRTLEENWKELSNVVEIDFRDVKRFQDGKLRRKRGRRSSALH